MRHNLYVRLIQFEMPAKTAVGKLGLLVLVSKPIHIFEGVLLADVRVQCAIRLETVLCDGVLRRERLGSSQVLRVDEGYALTERSLFQFLKVPPLRPEAFCDAV